jgi:hypothetical protein
MRRHLPYPRHARVLQRRVRVEAARDGVADERGALLLQQRDQPLLLGDKRVDPGRLAVEERGDGVLFGERGDTDAVLARSSCSMLSTVAPVFLHSTNIDGWLPRTSHAR